MLYQLKSNIKYVWWDLVSSVFGIIAGVIFVILCIVEPEMGPGKFVILLLFGLFLLALGIFGLVDSLLNWQWVSLDSKNISVRCLFFEIKRIPIEKIKRCWVCPVMIQYYKSWIYTYDFLVIDTAKTRKKHTIPNGFCRKKYRYIILPDTPEARFVLRQLPEDVRTEFT